MPNKRELTLISIIIFLIIANGVYIKHLKSDLRGLEFDLRQQKYLYEETLEEKIKVPKISSEGFELLTKIVEQEAGTEGLKGKVAVANVIINRASDKRFPDTVKDVIVSRGQFESYESGRYRNIEVTDETYQAVIMALSGFKAVDDNTLFFCNYENVGDKNKAWFDTLDKVVKINNHTFFR